MREKVSELSDLIKAALDSIEEAHDLYRGPDGKSTVRSDVSLTHVDYIRALCDDAGWDFVERKNGTVLRLRVPGWIYHADVEEVHSGGYCIKVMIAAVQEWDTVSRDALSNMLLSVCSGIKMVRASFFERADGTEHVYFESHLDQNASALEIDLALSSLSVACETVSRPVEALRSGIIAGEYLAFISWPSVREK